MTVKEYFNSAKETMYRSVFTRRMPRLLSLLVMLIYLTSNSEGSFASEMFRLVAEGTVYIADVLLDGIII